ncbi:MAG: hypothetical protein HXS46_00550 [Theionarchaea archaeon]|nr:hypothetical protein [Theionarchaea archaeon]
MKENLDSKPEYKRALIVVNKWWECIPVMSVLLNNEASPPEVGWPYPLYYPLKNHELSHNPQAVFQLSHVRIEVWCISDLLAKYPNESCYQSSSERKMDEMPLIFQYSPQPADLVVAVGTAAGCPADVNVNGSVICGANVFLHNSHPKGENPCSNWQKGPFDTVIPSSLSENEFKMITDIKTMSDVVKRFLVPPLNPAPAGGQLIADYNYVALGTVNVTDYGEYEKKDEETLNAYKEKKYDPSLGRSLETTHGLIRVVAGINRKNGKVPFLFVSGIVDRVSHFDEDVNPRPYAQNTTGAHNAGIVVAWMLPKIDALFAE